MDTTTLNTVIIVLIVVCVWLFILWMNSRRLNEDVHFIARQHNLLRNDTSARMLCRAVHLINPHLSAGVDYVISHDKPDEEPYISEWRTDAPKPTDDQLRSALQELADTYHEEEYAEMRRAEYPSVEEQLDAAYEARQGNTALQEEVDARIRSVKEKYPSTDHCV